MKQKKTVKEEYWKQLDQIDILIDNFNLFGAPYEFKITGINLEEGPIKHHRTYDIPIRRTDSELRLQLKRLTQERIKAIEEDNETSEMKKLMTGFGINLLRWALNEIEVEEIWRG